MFGKGVTVTPVFLSAQNFLCSEANPTGLLQMQPRIGLVKIVGEALPLAELRLLLIEGCGMLGIVCPSRAKSKSAESEPIHSEPYRFN